MDDSMKTDLVNENISRLRFAKVRERKGESSERQVGREKTKESLFPAGPGS
jgi:hypothetical protein